MDESTAYLYIISEGEAGRPKFGTALLHACELRRKPRDSRNDLRSHPMSSDSQIVKHSQTSSNMINSNV